MIEKQLVNVKNIEILIVDDTDENLIFLTNILIADGYSVSQASSGEQALTNVKIQLPDIVLLDVMMPEMDGFEVCRQIKANPETSNIPIIFISALDDEQSKVKGFEVGAIDYITKPFRKVEVLARVKIHIGAAQMRTQLERQTLDLQIANNQLQTEIAKRKQAEAAMEKRIVALTQPLEERSDILFEELFNLPEIQKLQDQFADAFGVASIITKPDGTPITKPSNFCRLCNDIIRKTEIGLKNCMHSDAILGKHNPDHPVIQPCLSGGLWDAGASITVGGWHVANWLIGQVRNNSQNKQGLKEYAQMIGANEQEFMKAHSEVPIMSEEQFRKVSEVLFTMSGQISQMAYQNVQQARFINDRKIVELALQESEERFRTTLYSIGDGVITTDYEGRIRLMNQLAEKLTGWKQYESVGKPLEEVFRIINEQSHEKVEIPVRKVLRDGFVVGLANHTLLINKDGSEIPITDSGAPIRNEKGEIVGVVLVFRDQTEERKAEKALIESKNQLELSLKVNTASVFENNFETGKVTATPELYQFLGYQPHEIPVILDDTFKLIHPDDVPVVMNAVADHFSGKTNEYFAEFRIKTKSGEWRWIDGRGKVVKRNEKGDPVLLLGISRDIHTRKLTEEALRNSEFFFRESQRAANIGSYKYDLTTGFWDSSEVLDQIFGIDKKYMRSVEGWEGLIFPDDMEMMDQHLKEDVIRKQKPFSKEYRIVRKSDGEIRWVNGLGQLNFDSEGNLLSLIGTIQDITPQKEAEESLRRNEQKFRALIENSSDAISLVDSNGIEFYHSSSCQHILGYSNEERNGKSMMELIHPEDRDSLINMYTEILKNPGIVTLFPTRVRHNNGSWLWIEGIANNLLADPDIEAIVINFRDITERKLVEIKLQRSEQELKKAQQITHIGSWHLNLANNEVFWTEELYKMYGFDPTLPPPLLNESQTLFTPESWELLTTSIANTAETGVPYEIELITIKIDGSNGWMWARGETVKDSTGKIVGLWGAAQDISARKHAEQLLHESETRFRTLIESSSDGISMLDLQGNIIFANQRKAEMLGQNSYSDLIGINIRSIISNANQEKALQLGNIFNQKGSLKNIEAQIVSQDGSTFWVEFHLSMVRDIRNNPSYIMVTMRDISERKQAEKQILDEKNLLRTLIDNLPDPIYVKDHDGRKMIANRADLENIGVSHETEVIGKSDLEIFNSEMGYRGYEDDLIVIESGEPIINREEVFFDKNGVKKWLLTTKIPILDTIGKPAGLVGIGRDITEQKKSELQIQKLTESIEQSPSTIVITDIYGTIEYVNPKFSEITGYTKEEAIGQNPRILKSGEIPDEVYTKLWEIISSGNVWRGELQNRKKNGELYWEWATITSIKNELGVITNYIAIKEDISLRKEMEIDLIAAKEKAEESDRLKSAFLANMSHEIRTPLNSIIGFSELLSDSDFEVDQKIEFINHIVRNGNNLLNIISDIVDISKIEAGEITIRKSNVQVNKFMSNICSQHKLVVEDKLLQLKNTCDGNGLEDSVFVIADIERLQQIFNNLISNALKFTNEGYIELGCKKTDNMIEFHVKDTGIGISRAFQDVIFDRFRQVETSLTRKFGGNGLGLAISKNLIELMGGKIRVESEPGNGSAFYFTLPRG